MQTITAPNSAASRPSRSPFPPRASRGNVASRILCLLLLAAALWSTVRVGLDEWRVQRAIATHVAQVAGEIAPRDMVSAVDDRPLPPRGALARGLTRAAMASGTTGARRTSLIADARGDMQTALGARRQWPAALVGVVFLDFVEGGIASTLAHRDLATSYHVAPFLADEGVWRVRFGLAAWPWLTPDIRQHVLDEGVWLAGLSPTRFSIMTEAFGDSPAGPAFLARLRSEADDAPPILSMAVVTTASSV